jgi:hypothetical protein
VSDRALQRAVAVVATVLLAVIATGSVLGSRTVADDLRDRARRALSAAGLGDVDVRFTGREAALEGGNDVEARLAASLVAVLPGVRQVAPAPDADRPVPGVARFELDRFGDTVQISGTVASPDDAADLKIAVAAAMRTTVTGDVAVDRSVGAAPWVPDLPEVLRAVAGVAGLELEVPGDGTVVLGGRVRDDAARARAVRLVADGWPDLRVVDTIDVRRAGA